MIELGADPLTPLIDAVAMIGLAASAIVAAVTMD